MIEEEDSSLIDNNTNRSARSRDFKDQYLNAKEDSLRLFSNRSGRNLTDEEECLLMNLSQNLNELPTSRKDTVDSEV